MGTPRIEKVVLGHDGSEGADTACRWLAGFAAALGAEVVVVQGYDPLGELGKVEPPLDLVALERQAADRLAGEVCAPLADAGVAHRSVLVEDDGVRALARVAADEGADLVVVGSHGRTGWRDRLLGRVASRLPQEVACPVVIVPQARPA